MVQLDGAVLIGTHFQVHVVKLLVDQADGVDVLCDLGGDQDQMSRVKLD